MLKNYDSPTSQLKTFASKELYSELIVVRSKIALNRMKKA